MQERKIIQMRRWFYLFLLVFACTFVAQSNTVYFKRITTNDGLSNGWVRCFYHDDYDFIWIGTADGLNRYDGISFATYKPVFPNGFTQGNVTVNQILNKNSDTLFICTDLGMYVYSYISDVFSQFPLVPDQIPILCAQNDAYGNLWLGTSRGLFKLNDKLKIVKKYTFDKNNPQSISNNYINRILLDSENKLWIGTKQGLNLYNYETDDFHSYFVDYTSKLFMDNDVIDLKEDRRGRIWLATALNGAFLLQKTNDDIRLKQITTGAILTLNPDSDDNLWLGHGSGGGVSVIDISGNIDGQLNIENYKYNPSNPRTISENSIVSIFEDKYNDIWIGTFGKGVNYYSKRSKAFEIVQKIYGSNKSISNDLVNDIYEEDDYLWVGTEGGLDRMDKKTGIFKHYENIVNDTTSLASNAIFDIFKDSYGNLWIGTWAGGVHLYNYNNDNFQRFLPDDTPGSISNAYVFNIAQDDNGKLWVTTNGGGLNLYNYQTGKFSVIQQSSIDTCSISDNFINDIEIDNANNMILLMYTKLSYKPAGSSCFTSFSIPINKHESGLSDVDINYITVFTDSKNNTWYGSSQGLIHYNYGNNNAKIYTVDDGLPNNSIKSILEDDKGNLWLGTSNGFAKFVHATTVPSKPVFETFSVNDGLPSSDFKKRSAFKNEQGYLYFGTSNGYVRFHPDSIEMNTLHAKTVLTGMFLHKFKSGDEQFSNQFINNIFTYDNIDLDYGYADFSIRFASLNYLNSEANQYMYKLEGYDSEWIDAKNSRVATYTNIKPGTYTFLVYGSNNDSVWSDRPASLVINIIPPWWNTSLLKVVIILFVLISAVLIIRLRFKMLKNRNKLLKDKVDERTADLLILNKTLRKQKKEIEEKNGELFIHQTRLEDLVKERTKELEKAKNKAEESDRLKSAFLANLSHEIRTPMNSIMGFASLLADEDSLENVNQYSDIIVRNSEQLNHIIDDIVLYSKLQTKLLSFSPSVFYVYDLFNDVKDSFNIPEYKRNVQLYIRDDIDKKMQLYSDYGKLRQVLTNIISNAYKYTEQGSIVLGALRKGNSIKLFVEDTGVGIPTAELKTVFKRFYRGSNIDKGKISGTGLGLSIVKEMVELLEGKVKAESEPGKGSKIIITLDAKR